MNNIKVSYLCPVEKAARMRWKSGEKEAAREIPAVAGGKDPAGKRDEGGGTEIRSISRRK